jgi:hypothetical protein
MLHPQLFFLLRPALQPCHAFTVAFAHFLSSFLSQLPKKSEESSHNGQKTLQPLLALSAIHV